MRNSLLLSSRNACHPGKALESNEGEKPITPSEAFAAICRTEKYLRGVATNECAIDTFIDLSYTLMKS